MRTILNPNGGRPIVNEDLKNFEPTSSVLANLLGQMGVEGIVLDQSGGGVVRGVALVSGILASYDFGTDTTVTQVRLESVATDQRTYLDGGSKDSTMITRLVPDAGGAFNFQELNNISGQVLRYNQSSNLFDGRLVDALTSNVQNAYLPTLKARFETKRHIPKVTDADYAIGYIPEPAPGDVTTLDFMLTGGAGVLGGLFLGRITLNVGTMNVEVYRIYGAPSGASTPNLSMSNPAIEINGMQAREIYVNTPSLGGTTQYSISLLGSVASDDGENASDANTRMRWYDTFRNTVQGTVITGTQLGFYTSAEVDMAIANAVVDVPSMFSGANVVDVVLTGNEAQNGTRVVSQNVKTMKIGELRYTYGRFRVDVQVSFSGDLRIDSNINGVFTTQQFAAGIGGESAIQAHISGFEAERFTGNSLSNDIKVRSGDSGNSVYFISQGSQGGTWDSNQVLDFAFSGVIIDQ